MINDLIEKLSNLRSQFNCFDENERDAYHTLSEAIKVLSERPEPCDDPRADVYYLAEKIGIHRLYALVVELCGEPEPCEDAVNRADVVDMLDMYPFTEYGEYETAREIVKRLPSVEPKHKTWKWIEYDSDEDKYDAIKCPCCKHTFTVDAYHWTDIGFVKDDFKFCPNCGEDMRQREENK